MADPTFLDPRNGGRIEGGFDAVVIGGSLDALAAAALLGKGGMKTVLVGGEGAGFESLRREFAPGYHCIDGDPLARTLDARLAETLDLYRHGLHYAQRRLDTVYLFSDKGTLRVDGDLSRAHESVAAMAPGDADRFVAFLETALDASRALRPLFEGDAMPTLRAPLATAAERMLTQSAESAVAAAFGDPHLRALIVAEAAFDSGARPQDALSLASLAGRWSGETAGLQGAVAIVENGAEGVLRAIRRAAQAAHVDLRPATSVARILVEQDRAVGVETESGGQIRAACVVAAMPARRVFLDLVGPALLDAEFQAALDAPPQRIASARLNIALSAAPDERADYARRFVYAPSSEECASAFGAARRGEVGRPLLLEAVAPSVFEPALAPYGGMTLSVLVHPVPHGRAAAPVTAIGEAARETLDAVMPGTADAATAIEVITADDDPDLCARPPILAGWARARRLQSASGIGGFFFCGPEAETRRGTSGAAGRRAAEDAVRFLRGRS